jgi:transposase-like protein
MAADALVLKVREAGRVVNVHALIAVAVNAEGYREILGVDVTTTEDGAGWLMFLRSLTARGLSGVRLAAQRRLLAEKRSDPASRRRCTRDAHRLGGCLMTTSIPTK